MIAVPEYPAVTFPVLLTDATHGFDDFHVTALLLAFVGVTVAFRVNVFPLVSVALVFDSFRYNAILFPYITKYHYAYYRIRQ